MGSTGGHIESSRVDLFMWENLESAVSDMRVSFSFNNYQQFASPVSVELAELGKSYVITNAQSHLLEY